ncbi:DUF5123 domain-containing protein [Maribellus sediminis]|uniref:DUF5123 domain-containing protein n=1 Tax=Maribellus sediminis TaxID=2696285 RepID=UPI001432079A|nr:DUF5123 domain-containing protein [Maribellus sediminis]
MNKTKKYIRILLGLFAVIAINACEDDISPVVEELEFSRVFTPLELEARISNQTTVTLTWGSNKTVEAYVVEISDDSLQFNSIIHTATVTPDELPFVYELPAGNSQYSARVKGTSTTVAESNWATLAFKSYPENLFNNYDIVMNGIGDITVSWTPGKAVTALQFTSADGETSYDISAEEQAAGVKTLSDVPNAAYTIHVLNGNKSRGVTSYLLEGDVYVPDGSDLGAAIDAANSGDVLILDAGGVYPFVGDKFIEKSLKIKGLDGELPMLYITEGVKFFNIGASLTPADTLTFENLYMSGYINQQTNDQVRGIFDMENDGCNVGGVKFIGCKMYNVGRQIIRLRGGADQTIGEFVVDDCIIHDLGRSSGSYGVFCATETNTNAKIVRITNSTIDSLVCHFIRYDDPVDCESIIVENCTFNKVPFASGRYLMDVRNAVISESIEVKNCIFGNTTYGDDLSITGIRAAEGVPVNISNSYCTTDFVNTDYSIVDMLTPLGVSSTSFWTDPDNGDYSFSGAVVEAGDPRWY